MILEKLQAEFLTALETEDRNWYRIRQSLDRVHLQILATAGGETWSGEYSEYLVSRIETCLEELIPVLAGQEEYEQALEVKLKLEQMRAKVNIQLTC